MDRLGRAHKADRTFASQNDAARFLAKVETQIDDGTWADPSGQALTLTAWSELWLESASRNVRARTVEGYRWGLSHILPELGSARLRDLHGLAIEQWVGSLGGAGLSSSSQSKAFAVLHTMLEHAVSLRMLPRNPATGVRRPSESQREMRFLTQHEVRGLADVIDDRYSAMVWTGCLTGLRFGELAELRGRDLDLLRGRVTVERQVQELDDGSQTIGPPKSLKGIRSVPLPKVLIRILRAHIERHSAPGPDDLVFPSPKGAQLRNSSFRSRFWTPAVKAAGLAPLRIHDMRHTAVALAIEAGGHPKAIQERMGHSSITVTLDRYGHLFESLGEDLAIGLDDLFSDNEDEGRQAS